MLFYCHMSSIWLISLHVGKADESRKQTLKLLILRMNSVRIRTFVDKSVAN